MKNFNYQLAGDNGVHFYPLEQHNNFNEILLSCFKNKPPNGVIDIIPSLVNLLVVFDNHKTSAKNLINYVESLNLDNVILEKKVSSHWEIPVCYEGKYGLDLSFISEKCNLSENKV